MRIITFTLLLISIISKTFAFDCQNQACGAVIDAGSTGSRLYIYTIQEGSSLPIIQEVFSRKVAPGLSTLSGNQKQINTYLDQLFSEVSEDSSMPVYIYATAGMRLLPSSKQTQSYAAIQSWFNNHPQWHLEEAKTITGQEEGLFGWLSVNYKLNKLNSDSKQVGVIDIGGSSVQITFPASEGDSDLTDVLNVNLFEQHYKIYTHSFLGLGQEKIIDQFSQTPECFIQDYPGVEVMGKGDALTCAQKITPLINQVHQVDRIVQPMVAKQSVDMWYGIGAIPNLANNAPFSYAHYFSNESLISKANTQVCHQSWESLTQEYNTEYLYVDCIVPAYLYALMVNGYGIDATQPIYFDAEQASWTLGALLYKYPNQKNK